MDEARLWPVSVADHLDENMARPQKFRPDADAASRQPVNPS
jgi:hypothetical protein